MSTRSEAFRQFWQGRKAKQAEDIRNGVVTVRLVGQTRIHVAAPFNPEFIVGARELGRWKPATRVWTFSSSSERLVIDLCERVYGQEAIVLVGFPA